ncbi:MAG: hypothetical protein EOP11_08290 [Proteobacteria bacterium]|nr:MAG: hypothetical protein EOP11_08290 [Pseudomonadota bacterium]
MLTAIIALIFAPTFAQAFPEMIRHHYVNCNSCHVSPNGGGLLNEYGRGMSAEVLSTWNYENEALFLHGLVKPGKLPAAVNIGGDIRALQVHRESKSVREGRYILMQAQLEAAIAAGPFTAVAAFGQANRENHIEAGLPRFYLMASVTDNLVIRAGRFLPAFGINHAQHTYPTRGALGFGFPARQTIEANYSGDQWHGALSASESEANPRTGEKERGVAFQIERFLSDKFRVGYSVWNGQSERQKRWVNSVHGILGFNERLYLLSEIAWQSRRPILPATARENGIYQFNRFGFEVVKGVHLLAIQEYTMADLKKSDSQVISFGAGALWYPRPHFEFELTFNQKKTLRASPDFEDYAYLMAHYYL